MDSESVAVREVAATAKAYWEQAHPPLAHISYNNSQLHSEGALVQRWDRSWLKRWLAMGVTLQGKRVGDYGIGGGLLGQVLCQRYAIGSYVGFDVAERSITAARTRIAKVPACHAEYHDVSGGLVSLMEWNLDVLISQQVIQHFPSRNYTLAWFVSLERSSIPRVLLEVRHSDKPVFSDWALQPGASSRMSLSTVKHTWQRVAHAVEINCKWISARLPSYHLDDAWRTTSSFEACAFTHIKGSHRG